MYARLLSLLLSPPQGWMKTYGVLTKGKLDLFDCLTQSVRDSIVHVVYCMLWLYSANCLHYRCASMLQDHTSTEAMPSTSPYCIPPHEALLLEDHLERPVLQSSHYT